VCRITDPARAFAVAQFSVDQAREVRTDIRFRYKANLETNADKPVNDATTDVMALNFRSLFGRCEFRATDKPSLDAPTAADAQMPNSPELAIAGMQWH
jgi:hypothetical protein